ncbi:MAG: RagB/SusD family nutrient uptake outer membrane protein [Bacteroidota bacterium]
MNMKYKIQAAGLALILGFSACKKDFLDQTPYNSVAAGIALKNDADMNAAINGVYASMRNVDLYGLTLILKGDIMSDNCFITTANSGRYLFFNQYNMINNDGNANNVWAAAYATIKNANLIINSTITSNDNVSQLKAEALTVRALMHFELVRNFATPYTADANKPGVPIVLSFDQDALPARKTIKEVYTQIVADLTAAAGMAKKAINTSMVFNSTGVTRTLNTSFISKYAISALLARVYQSMGDWPNAKTAALDVVNNGGFTLTASSGLVAYWANGTPRTDKVETIFEITADANNNLAGNGVNLPGLYLPAAAPYKGSYGDVLANASLYNLYSATDVRKNLITVGTRAGQVSAAYICRKYSGNTTDYDDSKVLRYADVLLILAEAYYNTGDIVNANLTLNTVAKQRDPSFAGWASTGTQVLEDILTERRKELAFEGSRFWDLVRLQRTFTKVQDQDAPQKDMVITPTNTKLVFPIPLNEINVNTTIGQNAGY